MQSPQQMTPEDQSKASEADPPVPSSPRAERRPWWPSPLVPASVENRIRQLRQENDRLRAELAVQRADLSRASLVLDSERQRRARSEKAMLNSYYEFSGWFDSAAFPMTCVGTDGLIDQANDRQLNLLGYSRREYIGQPLAKFVLNQEVVDAVMEAMSGGDSPKDRPTDMLRRDGSSIPVLISTERFTRGSSRGICCYVYDLSELVHIRSERRRSDGLFRQLAENIHEVFWMSTVDKSEILYVSPAYETVWGCSRESVYENSTSFLDSIVEEDRERVRGALPLQATEGAYCEEYRVARPDGTIRWVRDRAFPVRDEEGRVFRIAGLAEDITRIKQAEEKLENHAHQQRVLAELGHGALVETSLQKAFEEATARLAEALGGEYAAVLEFQPRENDFLLRAGTGWKTGLVGGTVVPDGDESQAGFTLLSHEPVVVRDLGEEARFRGGELLHSHGVSSGMTVVIEGRDHPFGVLAVHTQRRRDFTSDEANFLQAVANVLAAAVERNAAEKAQRELSIELARQRQKMDEILKNLPAVVWELRLDPETGQLRQEYVSDYVEMLLGYSSHEFLERPNLWQERIHPEDQERVKRELREIMAGAAPEWQEFRAIARNGRLVWIQSTKQVFRDEAGRPVGLRGVALDITERKVEEAKRQVAEDRFYDMVENLPGIVWELRVDPATGAWVPAFVSKYAEAWLGYPQQEWMQSVDAWFERIHPEDRERVRLQMADILLRKEGGITRFRWITRDGRTVWAESRKRVVLNAAGQSIGLRGLTVNITAQKQAKAERAAAEERFHAFMNHSPFVALMKNEEGRYIYGNRPFQEWCQSLGLDWYWHTDDEIFPEELARRYRKLDLEALDQGTTTQTLEISYDRKGAPVYWNILRFPVVEPGGRRLLGTVAIDVTERRHLEREILEISDGEQRRLGQELHDGLCQHLLGVALMSRTLADRMRKIYLKEAEDVQMISDFLYEALGAARGLMQGFQLADLKEEGGLLRALEEFAQTTSRLFGKPCTFTSSVTLAVTEADVATHLFRIAQEATHNAIKHGEPSRVSISLEREGDSLLLTVENDGKPLPNNPVSSGGIGLRTMNYRADLIGADLQFENRPEGVVVTCRLPPGRGIAPADG